MYIYIYIYVYIYIYTHTHIFMLFFLFFSIMVYHRIMNIILCAIQSDLVVHPFYIEEFPSASSKFSLYPMPLSFPLGNYKSVLYICESVSR